MYRCSDHRIQTLPMKEAKTAVHNVKTNKVIPMFLVTYTTGLCTNLVIGPLSSCVGCRYLKRAAHTKPKCTCQPIEQLVSFELVVL